MTEHESKEKRMLDTRALQASIRLSKDPEQIKANREKIRKAREAIEAQKTIVDALSEANMRMCDHADQYSSNWCGRDPGGGGCNTCGQAW
jgi:hypothetical protein